MLSSNKLYFAILQSDGNFVVYNDTISNNNPNPIWSTNTFGLSSNYLILQQSDGNLVLYDNNNNPIWSIF